MAQLLQHPEFCVYDLLERTNRWRFAQRLRSCHSTPFGTVEVTTGDSFQVAGSDETCDTPQENRGHAFRLKALDNIVRRRSKMFRSSGLNTISKEVDTSATNDAASLKKKMKNQ